MKAVIIQRFYPEFREAFFDSLSEVIDSKLIVCPRKVGKIVPPKNIFKKSYYVNSLQFRIGGNYIVFPFLFFQLIQLRPKVVITEGGQNSLNNLAVFFYSKIFGVPYIIWDLGKAYMSEEMPSSRIKKIYEKYYSFILRNSSNIFTYNSLGSYFFKSVYNRNSVILGNTVDTVTIRKILASEINVTQRLKDIRGISDRVFLYVGAINELKNLEELPELLNKLNGNSSLFIVGDGHERYLQQLKKVCEGKNVYFEGHKGLNEIAQYYKIADAFILPGLGGLAINQAMAFGLPVLCSSADGSEKDLIENGVSGLIYKDIKELVEFLKNVSNAELEKMGYTAQDFLFKNYSIESMVKVFKNNL